MERFHTFEMLINESTSPFKTRKPWFVPDYQNNMLSMTVFDDLVCIYD